MEYGSFQARGRIRAIAAGLCYSHSNTGSPDPLSETRDQTCIVCGYSLDLFPMCHNGNSRFFLFFFFWQCLRHVEVSGLGTEPSGWPTQAIAVTIPDPKPSAM